MARAVDLGPRRELTGAPLPPLLPRVADAVRAGAISPGHVAVISRCVDHIPAGDRSRGGAGGRGACWSQAARHEHPGALARTAAMLLARLDPDGSRPDERGPGAAARVHPRQGRPTDPRRCAAVVHPRGDRAVGGDPRLPGRAGPGRGRPGRRPQPGPAPPRRAGRGRRPITALRQPPGHGRRPRHRAAAHHGRGPARGFRRRADRARRPVAGRAAATQRLRGRGRARRVRRAGAALFLGRSQRLATRAQRLALIARDGGCCFPGCDRPAAWCEAHHVIPWLDGGPTDIDNLCLLCRYHHREFERRGWPVEMSDGARSGSRRRSSTSNEDRSATPPITRPTSTSDRPAA